MKTNEDAVAVAQQVVGLCDWLASLHWAQLEALGEDSRAIQAKAILDVAEQLLCDTQAMREAQASEVDRLLPYRNELAKQYQQRSYTSAIERLIPLAVEVRRWARRVAEYLLGEVAIDIKTHCEKCPWNAELSLEIKQQLLDERSYIERPTTPLVSTGGKAVARIDIAEGLLDASRPKRPRETEDEDIETFKKWWNRFVELCESREIPRIENMRYRTKKHFLYWGKGTEIDFGNGLEKFPFAPECNTKAAVANAIESITKIETAKAKRKK